MPSVAACAASSAVTGPFAVTSTPDGDKARLFEQLRRLARARLTVSELKRDRFPSPAITTRPGAMHQASECDITSPADPLNSLRSTIDEIAPRSASPVGQRCGQRLILEVKHDNCLERGARDGAAPLRVNAHGQIPPIRFLVDRQSNATGIARQAVQRRCSRDLPSAITSLTHRPEHG